MDVVLHKSTETTDCASSTSKKEAEQDDKATHFLIKKFMENTKTQLTLHGYGRGCPVYLSLKLNFLKSLWVPFLLSNFVDYHAFVTT